MIKSITQRKGTYKSTTSDDYILVIREETRAWILLIVSKSQKKHTTCKQLTKRFCLDSEDAGASDKEDAIGLWVFEDRF